MLFTELNSEFQDQCLGVGDANASNGVLFQSATPMDPDPNKRSVIIGLGGTGIRSVNMIKAAVKPKFKDWQSRISFLAIDTDKGALDRCTALDASERFVIGQQNANINGYFHGPAQGRSSFVNSWCPRTVPGPVDLTQPGANQLRLVCKMKMYYPATAVAPNDALLSDAIAAAVTRAATGINRQHESIQVFIVLGVAGGTGSGGLVELAHLVRREIPLDEDKIIGAFLMPDAMSDLTPSKKANGYAALKELDYYISARQRTDVDYLSVSEVRGQGKMAIDGAHQLYNLPILISGSADGMGSPEDNNRQALRAVSESIINMLARSNNATIATGDEQFLLSSFLANYEAERDNTLLNNYDAISGAELSNFKGEDSFSYNAIGVGTAAIPEQPIKAYAIERIVSTISNRAATGFAPADFKGFDVHPLGIQEAEVEMGKLLLGKGAIDRQIKVLSTLAAPEDTERYSVADVVAMRADTDLRPSLNLAAKKAAALKGINDYLDGEYANFIKKATAYMKAHGPRSLVCLYNGVGPDDLVYPGMKPRLDAMEPATNWSSYIENLTRDMEAERTKLGGLIRAIVRRTNIWQGMFIGVESAKLGGDIADHVYGKGCALKTRYQEPVRRFLEACAIFAEVLEKLGNVYKDLGHSFRSDVAFQESEQKNNPLNYNIIGTQEGYQWAKNIADQSIRATNFQQLKDDLIDDFINNMSGWIEYDPATPQNSPRKRFDKLVAGAFSMDALTLSNYFIENAASIANDAGNIVSTLLNCAQPRIHQFATGFGKEPKKYILVPSGMFAGDPALLASFQNACAANDVTMFQSYVQDKIVCYRFRCALPIYALAGVREWSSAYEGVSDKPNFNIDGSSLLHSNEGDDPDFLDETGVSWFNRPPIVYADNPRLPDAHGTVSREGRYLKGVLDPLFNQALACGLIERIAPNPASPDKYQYRAYLLDRPGWDYSFDPAAYREFPGALDVAGALVAGPALIQYFAQRNGGDVHDGVRMLQLGAAAAFNAPLNEQLALDRAKRALRKNTPLFIRLRKSMPKMQAIRAQIDKENRRLLAKAMYTVFPYALAFDLLREGDRHSWQIAGANEPICRLAGICFDEKPMESTLFEQGLKAKLLFDAFVTKAVGDDVLLQEVREQRRELVDNGTEAKVQDCLASLQWARDEAETMTAKFFADGTRMARRGFQQAAGLTDQQLEDIKALYNSILQAYENIRGIV